MKDKLEFKESTNYENPDPLQASRSATNRVLDEINGAMLNADRRMAKNGHPQLRDLPALFLEKTCPDQVRNYRKERAEIESELGEYSITGNQSKIDGALFSMESEELLRRYSYRYPIDHTIDGSKIYTIPQLGMTSRKLAGHESDGVKCYRNFIKVVVPKCANELAECKFERGPRQYLTWDEYQQALSTEVSDLRWLGNARRNIFLYVHDGLGSAGASDVDAAKVSMLEGMPVVNVDWQINRSGSPIMRALKGIFDPRYSDEARKEEGSFENHIDESINLIGDEYANLIAVSHGCGFVTDYLSHRKCIGSNRVGVVLVHDPSFSDGDL